MLAYYVCEVCQLLLFLVLVLPVAVHNRLATPHHLNRPLLRLSQPRHRLIPLPLRPHKLTPLNLPTIPKPPPRPRLENRLHKQPVVTLTYVRFVGGFVLRWGEIYPVGEVYCQEELTVLEEKGEAFGLLLRLD